MVLSSLYDITLIDKAGSTLTDRDGFTFVKLEWNTHPVLPTVSVELSPA